MSSTVSMHMDMLGLLVRVDIGIDIFRREGAVDEGSEEGLSRISSESCKASAVRPDGSGGGG